MKAQTMKRHLESDNWWTIADKGWPLYVCFDGKQIVMALMKECKQKIARALKGKLRCYKRNDKNDYELVKDVED